MRDAVDDRGAPSRGLRWVVAGLALLLFGLHLAARDDGARWYGDASQYTVHAENVVAGRPFAAWGHLHNTDEALTPAAYPPGYPLLLAPVVAASGRARAPIAALQAACLALAAWLFAVLYWRRLSPGSVVALVLLIGLNPLIGAQVSKGLSDLPFLAAAAAALVAIERAHRAETRRNALGWALTAGILGGGAILIRTLGVVLLPAFVLPAALRGDRRAALGVAALAAGVAGSVALVVEGAIAWEAGAQIVAGSRSTTGYAAIASSGLVENASQIPRHVAERVIDYARADHEALWAVFSIERWVHIPLRLIGLGVCLVGAWAALRRPRAVDVFGVLYLMALLPWSFGWTRYLLPAIPILYAMLLMGMETIWGSATGRSGRAGALALIIVTGAMVGGFAFQGARGMVWRVGTGPSPARADGSELVREHVPSDGTVLTTRDPRPLVFSTGRRASVVPRDTVEWVGYAARLGATHMLVTDHSYRVPATFDRGALDPWIRRWGWERVARNEAADLYRVAPPAEGVESGLP